MRKNNSFALVVVTTSLFLASCQGVPAESEATTESTSPNPVQNEESGSVTTENVTIEDISSVSDKEAETEKDDTSDSNDLRPQKNGFDENTVHKVLSGNYVISIPSYWQENSEIGLDFRGYAESGGKCAMLQIRSAFDETDPATFEVLYNDRDNMIDAIKKSMGTAGNLEFVGYDIYETEEMKGMTFDFRFMMDEYGFECTDKWVVFPSEKDNKWIYIIIIVSDNTEYIYDNDFIKILESIKKIHEESTEATETQTISSGIRPEFKEAMDSYEAFFDDYCEIMKKYKESPSDFSLLTEYLEYLDKYSEVMEKLDKISEEELSDEETQYYTEALLRITQKLRSVE